MSMREDKKHKVDVLGAIHPVADAWRQLRQRRCPRKVNEQCASKKITLGFDELTALLQLALTTLCKALL